MMFHGDWKGFDAQFLPFCDTTKGLNMTQYKTLASFGDENGNEYEMREDALYQKRQNGWVKIWINHNAPMYLIDSFEEVREHVREELPPGTYAAETKEVVQEGKNIRITFEVENGMTFDMRLEGVK